MDYIRVRLWFLWVTRQEVAGWEKPTSGRQWLCWVQSGFFSFQSKWLSMDYSVADLRERYQDKHQKSECVHVFMCVAGGWQWWGICEVLYLQLPSERVINPEHSIREKLETLFPLSLKISTLYSTDKKKKKWTSPFLKVHLVPATIIFVCLFKQTFYFRKILDLYKSWKEYKKILVYPLPNYL